MATQATPTAPSAPAAPAAPSSAPSAQSSGDPLEDLRSETIAWGHQGNTPSSDAPTEPPAAPTPGGTPEATPEPTPEGGTPPAEPAKTDAQTSSAHDSWIKRYGDPEKAASEAFALEQRAAAMAAELKALKEHPPATPSPSVPAAPQAQPAQQPDLSPVDQAIEYALTNDEKCRALIASHSANETRLKELNTTEIPALHEEIRTNQALIKHPNVDELVKDEARQALQRAEMTLAAREAKAAELDLRNRSLDMEFKERVGGYVDRLQHRTNEKAREAADERDAEAQAQEFVGHWPAAFERKFKEHGIDPEMRADIHEAVKVLALARPGRINLKDLDSFMDEAVKAEFNKVDKYHRIQARAHALRKTADAAPGAPTGAAATASPASPPADDPLEALRLDTRAAYRARSGR